MSELTLKKAKQSKAVEGRKSRINMLADSQHKKAKQSLLVGGRLSSKKKTRHRAIPLTLCYLELSPPVRSVDLVIHALGLKAKYKIINLFEKEQFSHEFSQINPLNTVPAIIDEDGFTIWESRAIMTYLVSKYGKDDSLYPTDLKKRAIVDQRLHFSNDAFYAQKAVTKPLFKSNVKPVQEQIDKVVEIQDSVEKLLVGNRFMAGDQLTLADYAFVTIMDILEVYAPSESKFPLTEAWLECCKSTMKDFDKVNTKGAKDLATAIKEKL